MSKALPFEIPKTDPWSFRVQEDEQDVLYSHLHMHPEIQIMWMKAGRGNWFIADAFGSFEAGDVFVIGSNVPHVFKSERLDHDAHALSVFFKPDAFGEGFFDLPELQPLNTLWERSKGGLRIGGEDSIAGAFEMLQGAAGTGRMTALMHLFEALQHAKREVLASGTPKWAVGVAEGERLDRVITYLMEHFDGQVQLEEVAEVAHLTPSSFCRFFKRRTRKTLVQFLTDLRLSEVQKLLVQTELPVAEIAMQCGFQNLSHFNKSFRKRNEMSPTNYRKRYREAL